MEEFKEHGNFTPEYRINHIVPKFPGANIDQFSDRRQQLLNNSPTYDNSALYAKLEHGALAQELYTRTGHEPEYQSLLQPPAAASRT